MANKYKMDIKNVHVLSQTKYRSSDVNKTKPDLHLLMPDCDPKIHDEYVKTIKEFQKPEVKIQAQQEEDKEENLTAEDLLKKLGMAGKPSSKKPKIVEVTTPLPKSSTPVDKPSKPVPKGETIIKETVVKSIDEYNQSEQLKKLNKSFKKEPESSIDFSIDHKKGNIKLKIMLPEEESAAGIDLQVRETEFLLETGAYFIHRKFQHYHPQLKVIRV
jgi:hypothetical protein